MDIVGVARKFIPEDLRNFMGRSISNHNKEIIKFFISYGPRVSELPDPHYFIHIPKCAGNSVDKYLRTNKIPTMRLGHSLEDPSYKYPYEIAGKENPKAFCVSRNPFHRLASAYFYLQKGGLIKQDAEARDNLLGRYDNFRDFVLKGFASEKSRSEIMNWTHFVPQDKFVRDKDGDLCLLEKNILHIENLDQDFSKYLASRGHEFKRLPRENKTKSGHNYFDLYSGSTGSPCDEMSSIVLEAYASDFETFGYSKNL